MQKLKWIPALVLSVLGSGAMADVADGQWRGVAGASLAATSGNSTSQAVLANVDLARLTSADKVTLGGFLNEGQNKTAGVTNTTAGKAGVFGEYDHNLTPTLFGFGKLGFDGDRITRMSLRTNLGLGLGMHVFKSATDTFDVSGGLGYTQTRYSVNQTIGKTTGTTFASTGLMLAEESSHQLSDGVFLKQRAEYFPGMTGEKAQLFKFNANLSVAMSKAMALTVGVTDTYNSLPPLGQGKNDFGFFTGVSVKLGN